MPLAWAVPLLAGGTAGTVRTVRPRHAPDICGDRAAAAGVRVARDGVGGRPRGVGTVGPRRGHGLYDSSGRAVSEYRLRPDRHGRAIRRLSSWPVVLSDVPGGRGKVDEESNGWTRVKKGGGQVARWPRR